MIKNRSVLCIIPAREGSKGLKNKNLKKLAGKPLVNYSLDAAKRSKYIDQIIVSTDSKKIQNIVNKYKRYSPFLRPKKYAQDNSPTSDVIMHVFNWLSSQNLKAHDYFVLLEPTSPLTKAKEIDLALEQLLKTKNSKCIVSVCEAIREHTAFNYKLNKNKYLIIGKNNKSLRRQELEKEYFLDGSFYISNTKYYISKKNFFTNKSIAFINKKIKSFEVDDEIDFIALSGIVKSKLYKKEL